MRIIVEHTLNGSNIKTKHKERFTSQENSDLGLKKHLTLRKMSDEKSFSIQLNKNINGENKDLSLSLPQKQNVVKGT